MIEYGLQKLYSDGCIGQQYCIYRCNITETKTFSYDNLENSLYETMKEHSTVLKLLFDSQCLSKEEEAAHYFFEDPKTGALTVNTKGY